jgi:phosphoglycolate phosphatase-like HAD superfamily hydrolase
MIKLLIFDWDDVFTLGAKEGYIDSLHNTLVELNVRLDPGEEHQRILDTWGKSHQEELKNLLREQPELLDKACKIYEDMFFGGAFVESLKYVPGANETLTKLAEKYILAIATGAHPDVLKKQIMPKFQVPDVFAQIISSYDINDVKKQKPHPHIIEMIMKEQRCLPSETLFIGDAESDVLMARAAGVEPIVVLTGRLTWDEAQGLKVRHIIKDVTRLPDLLDNEIN